MQAAILASPDDDNDADAEDTRTAEQRELDALTDRIELRRYIAAGLETRRLDGPELEYNQALSLDASFLPWTALDPGPEEQRQTGDAATAAPAETTRTQSAIMGRIFGRSAAAFLGVSTKTVGVGERSYPVLTAGVTAGQRAKSTAFNAAAATITTTELKPVSLRARYLTTIEDLATMGGLEQALRRDLSAAISDVRDDQIMTGDGTAPNVGGFLGGGLTAPTAPTATNISFGDWITAVADSVDGKYASQLSDVRLVLGAEPTAKPPPSSTRTATSLACPISA